MPLPQAPDHIRLLVVVNVFHPDRGGGAAVFSDMCVGLAQRGFDVTVRCAYPYYPEWTDKSGDNGLKVRRHEYNGVRVERYGIFIPKNPNSLIQRLLYEGSFLLSLSRSLFKKQPFDAVMVYCPLVGAVAYASLLKRFRRMRVWLNVQDLSADAAAAAGISKRGSMNRMLASIQNGLFNRADVWSSISPVMLDRLQEIRKGTQPVLYIPNWLNATMSQELDKLPSKQGRNPGSAVNLLYAGNIGQKQDLIRLLQSLAGSSADFLFRIHGNGGGAAEVEAWIRAQEDDRFQFGPFLDEARFARALHDADFFVITEKAGSGGSFIPSKMIPGMASQSPILAVSDAETPLGREMAEQEPGPWYGWDQLGAIPALLSGGVDRSQFATWQENAISRATFYHRNTVLSRLSSHLTSFARDGSVDTTV